MEHNGILKREVGEDIDKLAGVEIPPKCELAKIVPGALTRALRMGEAAYTSARRNFWLLVLLVVLTLKDDALALVSVVLKVIK